MESRLIAAIISWRGAIYKLKRSQGKDPGNEVGVNVIGLYAFRLT